MENKQSSPPPPFPIQSPKQTLIIPFIPSKVVRIFLVVILFLVLFSIGLVFLLKTFYKPWRFSEPPGMMGPINTFPSSPAPSETADWKTYTNDQYNFSIKYPNNWQFSSEGPNEPGNSGTTQKVFDKIIFTENYGNKLTITVLGQYAEELTRQNFEGGYLSLGSPCDTRWGFRLKDSEDILFGINKALKITGTMGDDPTATSFVCIYSQNQVHNSLVFSYYDVQDNIDQILSTFRFLEEDVPSDAVKLQGIVLENNKIKDQNNRDHYYLVIQTNDGEEYKIVYYDAGELDACTTPNSEIAVDIKDGQTVEIIATKQDYLPNELWPCLSYSDTIRVVDKR